MTRSRLRAASANGLAHVFGATELMAPLLDLGDVAEPPRVSLPSASAYGTKRAN
jgi:hypothetical protein